MLAFFKKIFHIDKQKKIQFVCRNGLVGMLKYLLKDESIDPSENNNKLIQEAITEGSYKIVEILLNDPRVNPNINLQENIKQATLNKKYKTLELIMSNERFDKTINISDSILETLFNKDLKAFEILTIHNDFEKEGFQSDISSVIFLHGYESIARSIINNKDIEFSTYANRSLEYSISYKYKNTAILLIDKFYNKGLLKFKIVKEIFKKGDISYLDYLLSLKLDDEFWDLAVEESINSNQVEFLKLLFKENKIKKDHIKNNKHIYYALKKNYEEMFYFFLESCNADPSKEKTAFIYAVKNGNLNIIKTLLNDNRIDPDIINTSYRLFGYNLETALSIAIEKSYTDIIHFLLKTNKIDLTLEDNFILNVASKNNNFETFLFLIENFNFNLSEYNYDIAFKNSIIFNNIDVFSFLLNEVKFNHSKSISLYVEEAVEKGSLDVLKLMIKEDSCIVSEDSPLILKSVKCPNDEMLPYLLRDNKVNHSLFSDKSLLEAIKLNDLSKVDILISSGLLTFSDDYIIGSSISKDPDILKYLLKKTNIDPNKSDYYYDSPIVKACKIGNEDIIKILINDDRVDPSVDNNEALLSAVSKKSVEIITLLLKDDRVTPSKNPKILMEAIHRKDLEIFNLISEYDDIDFKGDSYSYYFDKPLYASIVRGFIDAVDFLINNKNLDPSIENNKLIIEANKKGEEEISQLLFKDKRVYSTLKNADETLFNKLNKNKIQNKIADF